MKLLELFGVQKQ